MSGLREILRGEEINFLPCIATFLTQSQRGRKWPETQRSDKRRLDTDDRTTSMTA
jgi:hypothetical protein